MKKRITAVLCALFLLLTGCTTAGKTAAAPSGAPAQNTPPQQTDPSAPSQTAEPVPPETEAPTEPAPTKPVQSVTPGGFIIETDTSHYTPYRPPESVYTRPQGADLSEFHPENANGSVFPYAAATLYSSSADGYSWDSGYDFGFVDETGTIVTNGIYTNIYALTSAEYDLGVPSIHLPIWVVSRITNVTVGIPDDEFYPEGDTVYGAVAMDGSFAIPCEYCGIYALEDRILCIRDWETGSFVVFDLQGSPLLSSSQLRTGKNESNWDVSYSEGFYVIGSSDDNDPGNVVFYYYNEAGERVLGPFEDANAFHEGLAAVSVDQEGYYGCINTRGEYVIPPTYGFIEDFRDGKAIARIHDYDGYVILDKLGNVLYTAGSGYVSRDKCGFRVSGNTQATTFLDPDCNVLFQSNEFWDCQSETVISQSDNLGVTLQSMDQAETSLWLPNVSWVAPSAAVKDGVFMKGFSGYNYEDGELLFISEDMEVILKSKDGAGIVMQDYMGNALKFDEMTGEPYYRIDNGRSHAIYSADGELLAETERNFDRVINRTLVSFSGKACTARSFDGTLRFSYTYLDSGD